MTRMSSLSSREHPDAGADAATWPVLRRLLALAWRYRVGCIRVLLLQTLLLALGLSGLGLMGVGVDYIRYVAAGPSPAATGTAGAVVPSATPSALVAKPPRWPFGWAPPAGAAPLVVLAALGGGILLFALLRVLLNFAYTVAVTHLVQGRIVVDLRARVYDKMQRLSFRFFDANASSSIINRVTGDVQAVRMFVDGVVIQSVILLLSLGVYMAYMLRINVGLTAACLATTPALWWVTTRFSRRVRPAYERNRALFDDLVLRISENLQGAHVVKGFALQASETERFGAANRSVRDQQRWVFRQISIFNPLVGFLTQINLVVLLAFGGWLVVRHDLAPDAATAARVGLSVGELLVFTGLLQQFSGQVANIANIANSMQRSLISARRVFEVLDAPLEIESPPRAAPLPAPRGAVAFEGVTFGYAARDPVLRAVSFKIAAGECCAILGTTGAGKSTLLSLVPRFYDPQAGVVRVDGHDVRTLALDDLRRVVGIVFQESFLFSHTIAANIAFGHPEATRRQVEHAARLAAAHEFITDLPRGYDTVLQEGGADLSGGQRQRLAIARAILLEPAILLLDDPTAAIDPHTEREILQAMEQAMRGRTTFVVAHRLSTLRRADRVIVLDRGRLVEMGTHEELMRRGAHYRRIAALQLPDEESRRLLEGGGEGTP